MATSCKSLAFLKVTMPDSEMVNPSSSTFAAKSAEARSMNFEGMRRRGFSAEAVHALRNAYKVVYRKGLTVEAALSELAESAAAFPEVAIFRDSIQASTRGITR